MKKRLVVFSGAGMSAESGLKTFRDSGGLWEQYRIEEVATPQAWAANPRLVLDFYNQRRAQAYAAEPNKAHISIAKAEQDFDIHVITQNVDALHEKAGSSKVLHLHGELDKARSTLDKNYIVSQNGEPIHLGDKCPNGGQLRPHIVWFGEAVPAMDVALEIVADADAMIVIGTSLQVYPAAGLVHAFNAKKPGFYIDPEATSIGGASHFKPIRSVASNGITLALKELSK